MVDKLHHNLDSIKANLTNHFNNKFWEIQYSQYMCFNYYSLARCFCPSGSLP